MAPVALELPSPSLSFLVDSPEPGLYVSEGAWAFTLSLVTLDLAFNDLATARNSPIALSDEEETAIGTGVKEEVLTWVHLAMGSPAGGASVVLMARVSLWSA